MDVNEKNLQMIREEMENVRELFIKGYIDKKIYQKETRDLFIDYYREYAGRYKHEHQDAMNYDTIYINECEYKTFSPYCHECFKKYILLNGLSKNRIRNILVEGFVDVEIYN